MLRFELRCSDGTQIVIDKEIMRLGRAPDNDIVVQDSAVSRYHIVMYIKGENLIVEDAGSQNGFLLNGKNVSGTIAVNAGDRIFIGTREFLIVKKGGRPTATPRKANKPSDLGAGPFDSDHAKMAANIAALKPRTLFLAGLVLVLIAIGMKKPDANTTRTPASEASPESDPIAAIDSTGYRSGTYRAKSISEVEAEALFLEAMRDYENANFSRAIRGFENVVEKNRTHDGAIEYLQLADNRLKTQMNELMKDAERSYSNMQYRRSKGQLMKVLSIMTEQVAGFGNRLANELSTGRNNDEGQEATVLKLPCAQTKNPELCKKAQQLIKKCREALGEEDALR